MDKEIVYCKDCIHRPYIDEDHRVHAPLINGDIDYACPFVGDDPYYSRAVNDNFFCANGEKAENCVLIKTMSLPSCCYDCPACEDTGTYYYTCILTESPINKQQGDEKRIKGCPLTLVTKTEHNGRTIYIEVEGDE